MTNQEAIEILKRLQEPEAWESQITDKTFAALEIAIDNLRENNSIALLNHIRHKCYEIITAKYNYNLIKDNLISQAESIKSGSEFWESEIYRTAAELKVQRQMLNTLELDISQLCNILGGEYLKMLEEIVQDNKGE